MLAREFYSIHKLLKNTFTEHLMDHYLQLYAVYGEHVELGSGRCLGLFHLSSVRFEEPTVAHFWLPNHCRALYV